MTDDPIMFELQVQIEELFNKNQLMPRLREHFSAQNHSVVAAAVAETPLPEDFLIELLVQMSLHKRTDPGTMMGILITRFDGVYTTEVLVAALEYAVNIGLVKYIEGNDQLVVVVDIPKELQHELDCFQYPLPMVVEPTVVRKNTDTGYMYSNGSIILRNNHHNYDVNLHHINRCNSIKLTINQETAALVKNKGRNLDKPKENESMLDFQKRKRAFEKFLSSCETVMHILSQAGNTFYLTHKVDKRGRTYCQGYHVNYQGTPWNKAVLELAHKEKLAA